MEPRPGVFDHELDSVPPRSVVQVPPREEIALYQRLVVNPLLAFLLTAVVVAILSIALKFQFPRLFAVGVGLVAVDLFLFRYRCLDCKATGWLLRYRRHVCSAIIARWQRGELPRFCGPAVKIQLASWIILAASVSVLALIMLVFR
jgi:hypothetical protein